MKKPIKHRSANFVPQLLLALQSNAQFSCALTDLPKSYQSQPYNLAAKILSRGGIQVKIVVNRERNIFVAIKEFVSSQTPTATAA